VIFSPSSLRVLEDLSSGPKRLFYMTEEIYGWQALERAGLVIRYDKMWAKLTEKGIEFMKNKQQTIKESKKRYTKVLFGRESMFVVILAGDSNIGIGKLDNDPIINDKVSMGDFVYYWNGGIKTARPYAVKTFDQALDEDQFGNPQSMLNYLNSDRSLDIKRKKIEQKILKFTGCAICGDVDKMWFVPENIWHKLPKKYWDSVICGKCFKKLTGIDPNKHEIQPGDERIRNIDEIKNLLFKSQIVKESKDFGDFKQLIKNIVDEIRSHDIKAKLSSSRDLDGYPGMYRAAYKTDRNNIQKIKEILPTIGFSPYEYQAVNPGHLKGPSFSQRVKDMFLDKVFTKEDALELGEVLNIDWDEIDIDEFVIGFNVELEHGTKNKETNITDDDPEMTAMIVLAHIYETEGGKYYSNPMPKNWGKKETEQGKVKEE